jgi:hypothetical protein
MARPPVAASQGRSELGGGADRRRTVADGTGLATGRSAVRGQPLVVGIGD